MSDEGDSRAHGLNHAPLPEGMWLAPGFCAGCDEERPRSMSELGCDCTELCGMGPTCPGGILARLPGAGCASERPEEGIVSGRPCYRCGKDPAEGYASIWTAAEGERFYCHGDDEGLSCYEWNQPADWRAAGEGHDVPTETRHRVPRPEHE